MIGGRYYNDLPKTETTGKTSSWLYDFLFLIKIKEEKKRDTFQTSKRQERGKSVQNNGDVNFLSVPATLARAHFWLPHRFNIIPRQLQASPLFLSVQSPRSQISRFSGWNWMGILRPMYSSSCLCSHTVVIFSVLLWYSWQMKMLMKDCIRVLLFIIKCAAWRRERLQTKMYYFSKKKKDLFFCENTVLCHMNVAAVWRELFGWWVEVRIYILSFLV